MTNEEFEHAGLLTIVAMSAERAKALAGRKDEPKDLGPADPKRYREGAREYGFRPKTWKVCACATCVQYRAN